MYSDGLRNRLGVVRAFKGDFDDAFRGFIDNKLPKDDLYREIEAAHAEKAALKKQRAQGIMGGGASVLPKVKVSKDTEKRDKDVVEHARKKAELAAINA